MLAREWCLVRPRSRIPWVGQAGVLGLFTEPSPPCGGPVSSTLPASCHQDLWQVGAVIVPICEIKKLRPRKRKSPAQSDPVYKRRI